MERMGGNGFRLGENCCPVLTYRNRDKVRPELDDPRFFNEVLLLLLCCKNVEKYLERSPAHTGEIL